MTLVEWFKKNEKKVVGYKIKTTTINLGSRTPLMDKLYLGDCFCRYVVAKKNTILMYKLLICDEQFSIQIFTL